MVVKKFILSGGGTGGHIYPAIAIANELKLKFKGCDILFVGASNKMEMQKVPQAGYPIKGLWIAGLQRKISFDNLLFPLKLGVSMLKSAWILRQFKPDVVIGTGGFASGPLLKVASLFKIPTLIQEQNSFPGITNKWLAKKASSICVAYPNLETYFPKNKIALTGNPVRQDLLSINSNQDIALAFFGLDASKKTILVLGGSLGAKKINQFVAANLALILAQNTQILWQCGKLYLEEFQHFNNQKDTQVVAFIEDMKMAYTAADIIISRAGASSVSELCLVGKPVIFIPSPNVAEDHQTKNATAIVSQNAAILIKENQLENQFETVFCDLINNETYQNLLSTNIKKLAKPDATHDIVGQIEQICNNLL